MSGVASCIATDVCVQDLAPRCGSERMEYDFVGGTVNVAARVQTVTRIHQADVLVTEALSAELDVRFVLMSMPAEFVKRIAEPVRTYAVREGPSAAAPSAEEAGDR
jgi:class 3 adenylate cyclase